MIDDLRHFKADDLGAFQITSQGDAAVALVCLAVLCLIFSPWLK